VSYLEVDPGLLALVGARLTAAIEVVDQVRDERDSLKGLVSDCGHAQLHDASCEFLDEWAYGLGCLKEDAEALAEMLTQSGRVYIEMETQIARSFGG
jgi:hypothetical protein